MVSDHLLPMPFFECMNYFVEVFYFRLVLFHLFLIRHTILAEFARIQYQTKKFMLVIRIDFVYILDLMIAFGIRDLMEMNTAWGRERPVFGGPYLWMNPFPLIAISYEHTSDIRHMIVP